MSSRWKAQNRERHNAYMREYMVRWRAEHEGHSPAWNAVRRAIRDGRLVRGPCVVCGSANTVAHHVNGYAPENRLDVEWVCRRDHRASHQTRPDGPASARPRSEPRLALREQEAGRQQGALR